MHLQDKEHFILPNWPAPANIRAYSALRTVGNLAVAANRALLKEQLQLPSEPIWLKQTHSTIAIPARPENTGQEADAAFTMQINQICAVLTADCLPILVCDEKGTQVAAIHAGWRGLANGVIENTFHQLSAKSNLMAWLGPAIGPAVFEVGEEVRALFVKKDLQNEMAFLPSPQNRWLGNLPMLATFALQKLGITQIYGGHDCTYSDKERFFSFRRDGQAAGRMASLIWMTDKIE